MDEFNFKREGGSSPLGVFRLRGCSHQFNMYLNPPMDITVTISHRKKLFRERSREGFLFLETFYRKDFDSVEEQMRVAQGFGMMRLKEIERMEKLAKRSHRDWR